MTSRLKVAQIPEGTCECGCGQIPPPATRTMKDRGWVKGKPVRFVPGHSPSHQKRRVGPLQPATNGPKLTKKSLDEALIPENNCQVARFRTTLDSESLKVFDEALDYDKQLLPAPRLFQWLLDMGYDQNSIPDTHHIVAHRNKKRPCRCRS